MTTERMAHPRREERQQNRSELIRNEIQRLNDSIPGDPEEQINNTLLESMIVFAGGVVSGLALSRVQGGSWYVWGLLTIVLVSVLASGRGWIPGGLLGKLGGWLRKHRRRAVVLCLLLFVCGLVATVYRS